MPDGSWPNAVLLRIVPKLSWKKNQKKIREKERKTWEGFPKQVFWPTEAEND
jgi:hypothetical protein